MKQCTTGPTGLKWCVTFWLWLDKEDKEDKEDKGDKEAREKI